jgi:hypothetical protein
MQSVGGFLFTAIDEEKVEEIRGANIIMFNGIDWRPVACGCRNNTTTNRQIESRGNRSNLCRDLESNKAQKHNNQPHNSDWSGCTIVLLCLKDT